MAWTASNIFIRCAGSDRESVLHELEALLVDSDQQADSEQLLDSPPPLTVGPVCNGWLPLVCLRGWVRDAAEIARLLSERCDAVVISSEVLGCYYRLRHVEYRSGAEVAREELPNAWDSTTEAKTMPLYRDVEQLCFALLLDHGIAAPAILAGSSPIDADTLGEADLGDATLLRRAGAGIATADGRLRGVRYEGDEAPLMARQVVRHPKLSLFDDRFVEGQPSDGAVTRLLQLEAKIRDRGRRLYDSGLDLTITYYNGAYQQELDEALRARDHFVVARQRREQIPWWQFWRYFGKIR